MNMAIDSLTAMPAPAGVSARCAHCTLPVPEGLLRPGEDRQFCCAGCRAVYDTVHACGLDNYYRLRDAAHAALAPARPGETAYDVFDQPAFEALYVTRHDEHLRSADLYLEGVTCAACIWLVEKLPVVARGVVEARLSLRRATVRVTWDSREISLSAVARTLDTFGYVPHPDKGVNRESAYRRELRQRLVRLGVAGAIAGNLMLVSAALYAGWAGNMDEGTRLMFRLVGLGLGVTTLAWPGQEFFRSAWTAVRTRTINLDLPIVFALLAGGVGGVVNAVLGRDEIYFDSLAMLVFLLLVGRFLQFRQQRSAESSMELLFSMTPSSCRVVDDAGAVRELPVAALEPGSVVEVLPGGVLPADGVVVAGASTVDQALLTGESSPVAVGTGSEVFGGSYNGPSPLRVRVTQVAEATRVGRLMRLLEQGLSDKPDIVKFSDKVGRAFVVAVTAGAALVFAYWAGRDVGHGGVSQGDLVRAIDHTVAFLIVTCPCVLALATPMTLAIAIGQLARRDILVKSGAALEKLSRGGRLLLDKTGTLTRGRLVVTSHQGDRNAMSLAAAIEAHSTHPVARAISAAFPSPAHVALTDIQEHPGGISAYADGRTVRVGSPAYLARHGIAAAAGSPGTTVLVAVEGAVAARITLSDELRPDSAWAVRRLSRMGFRPEIWSGDAPTVVESVAHELGIAPAAAHGGVSPEDKLVAARTVRTAPTLMIGDGVNDAAALAAATVGIAVHGGSEASLAAADVYIARPGLSPVVDLVSTARRTLRVVRRNFAISLAYNLLAGTLAATGHMNPLIAAILMPLSSATVLATAAASMRSHKPEARA